MLNNGTFLKLMWNYNCSSWKVSAQPFFFYFSLIRLWVERVIVIFYGKRISADVWQKNSIWMKLLENSWIYFFYKIFTRKFLTRKLTTWQMKRKKCEFWNIWLHCENFHTFLPKKHTFWGAHKSPGTKLPSMKNIKKFSSFNFQTMPQKLFTSVK